MSDGALYVTVSYALTALVLGGYAVGLALRARRVRRRRAALAREREAARDGTAEPVPVREVTHV